jgi:hypothetical protein
VTGKRRPSLIATAATTERMASGDDVMLHEALTNGAPWWSLLLGTVAVLLLACEMGYRWGLRQRHRGAFEARKGQADMVVGALVGLLGLLLAFSFSIAEGRYQARKSLVLEDANAIGTTFLRAGVLAPDLRATVESLLREYVSLRTNIDPRTLGHAMKRSEDLQRSLWDQAMAAAREAPDSEAVALFEQSLNQMIDLHESRITVALHQRLPPAILYTLAAVAVLAFAVVGGSGGLAGGRSVPPIGALALAVSAVLVLVVELDRPLSSQLFEVNQAAMRDLHESLGKPTSGR